MQRSPAGSPGLVDHEAPTYSAEQSFNLQENQYRQILFLQKLQA